VVKVAPGQFPSHYEVGSATAEAKKQAKKQPGTACLSNDACTSCQWPCSMN
jgi:hypothetical protein